MSFCACVLSQDGKWKSGFLHVCDSTFYHSWPEAKLWLEQNQDHLLSGKEGQVLTGENAAKTVETPKKVKVKAESKTPVKSNPKTPKKSEAKTPIKSVAKKSQSATPRKPESKTPTKSASKTPTKYSSKTLQLVFGSNSDNSIKSNSNNFINDLRKTLKICKRALTSLLSLWPVMMVRR